MLVRHTRFSRLVAVVSAAVWSAAWPALAGPPYVSDDPEPTELGRWEVYSFASVGHTPGLLQGAAGLDLNYGPVKDLQLTAVLPVAFDRQSLGAGRRTRLGAGDVELAAKYRFLHQSPGSPLPDVAVFPRLFLPTAGPGFGSGRASLLLPVWAEKDFGRWSLFGGGGYTVNPGPGNRNYWLTGVALSRALGDRLAVGVEVYHQTPDADDARPYTAANLGLSWRLNPHWSLLMSGGPGLQNGREQGQYSLYASLKADY